MQDDGGELVQAAPSKTEDAELHAEQLDARPVAINRRPRRNRFATHACTHLTGT